MVLRKRYLDQIRPFVGTDVIKVITGIRRCGKSVLMEQIRDEILAATPKTRVIYVDLEDKANAQFLKAGVLFDYLEAEVRRRRGAPTAILSMDNFDFSRDGVEHLHLPDFILDDK